MDQTSLTIEEKNKIMFLIDFYCSPLTSCSTSASDFAEGYNYAISKLKEKINLMEIKNV
jgi:hypothetical protein